MVADSASIARKPRMASSTLIPIPTRIKARNLYVLQSLPAKEVAAACGITEQQVYKLVQRHKWAELRRQSMAKLSAPLQARELEQIESISVAAASLSDEGLLGSLKRANEATESRSEYASKDAQAFASAARSLMQVGRTLRGMDGANTKGGSEASATHINLYVGRFGPAVSEKNVTPGKAALEAGAVTVDVAAK